MKRFAFVLLAIMAVLSAAGCATVKGANGNYNKEYITTGLFETGAEAKERAKNLVMGATTCPLGLVEAGFDPSANNVVRLPGAQAQQYIVGTDKPQLIVNKPSDIAEYAEMYKQFVAYEYPIKALQKDTDFMYFNKQNSLTTGTDAKYYIVCREGIVFNHGLSGVERVHQPAVKKQFGGNVGEFLFDLLKGSTKFLGL